MTGASLHTIIEKIPRAITAVASLALMALAWPGLVLATVSVDPALPASDQSFTVTTTITRNDTCYQFSSQHSINGSTISIEITEERTGGFCLFVVTDFDVDEVIDPIPAGDYAIEVSNNGNSFDTASVKVVDTLPFAPLEPIEGAFECGNMVFDWEDAPAVFAPSYEVIFARDPGLTDIVLTRVKENSSRLFIDTEEFYPPLSTDRLDMYWTVRLTGANGKYAESVAVFDMKRLCDFGQSGGGDVIVTGLVTSDISSAALAGASIEASILRNGTEVVSVLTDKTDKNGEFIIEIPGFQTGDEVQVAVTKNTKNKQSAPQSLSSSAVIQSDFSLNVAAGGTLGPVLRLLFDPD